MSRYHLRRPSPPKTRATRRRRQDAGPGAVGPARKRDDDEIPSTTGASSSDDGSDDDDDESPPPKESNVARISNQVPPSGTPEITTTLVLSTSSPGPTFATSSISSTTTTRTSTSTTSSTSSLISTQPRTSQGIGAVVPSVTITPTTVLTASSTSSSTTSSSMMTTTSSMTEIFSSKLDRPTQPSITTISILPPPPLSSTGNPAEDSGPPRREPTLMSKGAQAAAITLSILGAIALIIGILFYCKRRRRRHHQQHEKELALEAANHATLRAPETAYMSNDFASFAAATRGTLSTDRSNTYFSPDSYSRPFTISTNGNQSQISIPQSTLNPFADPPLNKAYDVLAGRPRSTTLTDSGSWNENPFRDPESERFDPFGELQAKARRERIKHVEQAGREAELEMLFGEMEKIRLTPPESVMDSKGSAVTLEGLGVLDRTGEGAYR